MSEEYRFGRRGGACAACGAELAPGTEHYSALLLEGFPAGAAPGADQPAADRPAEPAPPAGGLPLRRLDLCARCWRPDQAGSYFSFWKTTVPEADPDSQPLARRIDTQGVYEVFRRLEGQQDELKQRFRFILALILMRRKRLRFSGVVSASRGEYLVLEDRDEDVAHKVLDPGLGEEEIDSLRGEVDKLLGAMAGQDGPPEAQDAPAQS